MNIRLVTRSNVFAIVLCLVAASPAWAQEDGVYVDPDSPAGKEYAIPLEEARRNAAGGGGETGGSSGNQPLFGAGIEPADPKVRGADSPTDGGSVGRRGGADTDDDLDGGPPGARDLGPGTPSSAAIKATAGGSSDTVLTAGIVALVLAAGLLAGVALRRALRGE